MVFSIAFSNVREGIEPFEGQFAERVAEICLFIHVYSKRESWNGLRQNLRQILYLPVVAPRFLAQIKKYSFAGKATSSFPKVFAQWRRCLVQTSFVLITYESK